MVKTDDLKPIIVDKMKMIRNSKGLNLDQAAKLTGISKAMLSQIERGQSIPTITTLWKIATGYKVPLTYFLEKEKNNYTIVDILKTNPIYEENNKMRTYTLFPYNPVQNFEMLYIEFDTDCIHESAKHMQGVEEYIFVQDGSLELCLSQECISLMKNQCFRFQADVTHSYRNTSADVCKILNIIFYPTTMPMDI